ncbi:unnamed protein product, partial [Prunus brigantina]
VSQAPSKDSSLNKNECKELKVSKPQTKPSKKMKFVSSAETEPGSTTTFSEEPKSSRGINTMPRVVKRKLQKIKLVIEYNKRGKPYGPALRCIPTLVCWHGPESQLWTRNGLKSPRI